MAPVAVWGWFLKLLIWMVVIPGLLGLMVVILMIPIVIVTSWVGIGRN